MRTLRSRSSSSTVGSSARSTCQVSGRPPASAASGRTARRSTPSRRSTRPRSIYRYDVATGMSDGLSQAQARLRPRRLRDHPGLLREQGRDAGPDVPQSQEGDQARRQGPDAPVRLRRVQHPADPSLQRQQPGLDGDGGHLRRAQPPGRRRVRRGVAQGGHEAEEAERLRRLHRRGRVARSRTGTRRHPGWRSRAAPTAACSSGLA